MLNERQLVASNLWKSVRSGEVTRIPVHLVREYTLLLLAAHLIAERESSFFTSDWHNRSAAKAPDEVAHAASKLLDQLDYRRSQVPDFLERAWHDYSSGLDRWLNLGSVSAQIPIRIDEEIAEIGRRIDVHLREQPRQTWLYVFDFIFRVDNQRAHAGPAAERRGVAEFAATLAMPEMSVTEMSSWSGDVAVLLASMPESKPSEFIVEGKELNRKELIWLLRLAIFGVPVSLRERIADAPGFLVVDAAEAHARYRRHDQTGYDLSRAVMRPLYEGLAVLFVSPYFLRLKTASLLFADLVRSGRLCASVRLPKSGLRRSSTTAWVVSGSHHFASTLMMDLRDVDSIGQVSSAESISRFAASMVLLSMGAPFPRGASFQIPDAEAQAVDTILRRRFKNGYADIPGISAQVSAEQIARQGYASDPSLYIRTDLDTSAFERLDAQQLEAVLKLDGREPSRFYIIGDNGEGKSHYLRLLAAEMISSGRTTVGMSSNVWDRFDFDPSESPGSRFVYMGTRTSKSGVDGVRSGRQILERFESISVDEERLSVFRSVLSQIGLSDTIYLVSRRGTYRSVDAASLENSRRLSILASENEELFRGIDKRSYRLAFKHKRSSDAIVPFDELSSGEQQVISLIVRLVLGAAPGRLLLIDEPETSLHVGWQRALPQVLEAVSNQFRCDMVIATHSAVMVASARASSDYCFSARNGEVVPIKASERRSVDGVLINGFRTYTPFGKELYEQCARIVAKAIERANLPFAAMDSLDPLIEQLSDLRRIAEGDVNARDQDSKKRDIDLIATARMAIERLMDNKKNAEA
jgi:ABC-type molybdenum transport system ATPase subunit/photorepair protein PhrA